MSGSVASHPRLLLVEDDPALLELLTEFFEDEDYDVRGASCLADGVELLQEEPVDLIVTDLFSPSFSPTALTDLDVLTRAAPAIPVVVTTAHAEAGQIDPAQYGLAAIVLKPFQLDDLLARIRGV